MRQLLYVSDSLVGGDVHALDRIMVQSRSNNAIDGVTGLLWTDGARFAQVIEGGDEAIAALLQRLRTDPRHANFTIVHDAAIDARECGAWAMARPADDLLTEVYEQRLLRQLERIGGRLSEKFGQIIAGSRPAVY